MDIIAETLVKEIGGAADENGSPRAKAGEPFLGSDVVSEDEEVGQPCCVTRLAYFW